MGIIFCWDLDLVLYYGFSYVLVKGYMICNVKIIVFDIFLFCIEVIMVVDDVGCLFVMD